MCAVWSSTSHIQIYLNLRLTDKIVDDNIFKVAPIIIPVTLEDMNNVL